VFKFAAYATSAVGLVLVSLSLGYFNGRAVRSSHASEGARTPALAE
jgi:hypothetical protein